MKSWTAADIPEQTGKVAIITGSNSGIGFSAALALARKGCEVFLACRNEQKAIEAGERIRKENPEAKVDVEILDLASLASIRDFAQRMVQRDIPIDILINNAAVMATPHRQRTADGFEMQFGTNHLGHFALTGLLMPALVRSRQARIVTVSSIAHQSGTINFDDPQGEKQYDPWTAYRQSKLANLLFALELNRRLISAGAPVMSVAAHPGLSRTSIISNGPGIAGGIRPLLMKAAFAVLAQSADRGALPMVFAATSPSAVGGDYYGPNGIFEWRGSPAKVHPGRQAQDEAAAKKLWEISQSMTAVRFL